jgi:hypothetical protein
MGKGAGDNHPPLFEKLRMAKLIYHPYFCIKFRTNKPFFSYFRMKTYIVQLANDIRMFG